MQEISFEGHTYQISFGAMPDELKKNLSQEELDKYLDLLEKAQLAPKKHYEEIKAFCNHYPTVPEILNLLTFAHLKNFKIKEAEQLIEETYSNFPNYLFAKINFADQCMRKKKIEKVKELFSSFDLQELYPGKRLYHTSEFRGFLVMMSYYFLALKDREKALHYFEAVKKIEPHNPSVLYLEKKLFKQSLLSRLFHRNK